jgi:hypothetical protein
VTVRLRTGDTQYLSDVFPTRGYNKALQAIVSAFVDKHREAVNRQLAAPTLDLDVELPDE